MSNITDHTENDKEHNAALYLVLYFPRLTNSRVSQLNLQYIHIIRISREIIFNYPSGI